MKRLFAFALLALSLPAMADELPVKPEPAPHTRWELVPAREMKHTFSDMAHFRTIDDGVVEWTYVGTYAADMITSAQVEQRYGRAVEVGPVCHGTHSMTCVTLAYGGIAVARLVVSHILTKHLNHWYTDMIAGAIVGHGIGGHIKGAWDNSQK